MSAEHVCADPAHRVVVVMRSSRASSIQKRGKLTAVFIKTGRRRRKERLRAYNQGCTPEPWWQAPTNWEENGER
jgi:hypothetical protein